MSSVLQDWVMELPYMQQSVLIASVRGPDGIRKDHPVKVLCRWLRRSFLISAFDGRALLDPYEKGGGSFTGPCQNSEVRDINHARDLYLRSVDEIPHHFQLHFMHASEILGYKHPDTFVRTWWNLCYNMLVNDAHLRPESEEDMDKRLGDNEQNWRAREEVIVRWSEHSKRTNMYSTFAKELAERAHAGQVDKAGKPYIEHVYTVANSVESEDAKTVAYLHDLVEDTDYTLDSLRDYFPARIVDAVDHLTRRKGEPYEEFIGRVKQNALATEVKIADLKHNMQLTRLKNPTLRDFERVDKYWAAYKTLTQGEDID